MNSNLSQLAKDQSLSQQDLADMLGISRPTIAKILDNPDLLSIEQLKTLADRCNVSINYIVGINTNGKSNLLSPNFESAPVIDEVVEERDNIPHNSKVRFENTMLYVLGKIGAKPNVGQTLLYKIFYFIDFDYYEKYEEQLMGLTYIKNHFGPTPKYFRTFVDEMIKENKLEEIKTKYFKNEQTKYLPRIEPDLSCFTALQLQHIDWEIARFKDMSAVDASHLSHLDVPWIGTELLDQMEYETVFYRTAKTSVRKYEDD
jgi:transcriptional regulator with XRE-family HTH domain